MLNSWHFLGCLILCLIKLSIWRSGYLVAKIHGSSDECWRHIAKIIDIDNLSLFTCGFLLVQGNTRNLWTVFRWYSEGRCTCEIEWSTIILQLSADDNIGSVILSRRTMWCDVKSIQPMSFKLNTHHSTIILQTVYFYRLFMNKYILPYCVDCQIGTDCWSNCWTSCHLCLVFEPPVTNSIILTVQIQLRKRCSTKVNIIIITVFSFDNCPVFLLPLFNKLFVDKTLNL